MPVEHKNNKAIGKINDGKLLPRVPYNHTPDRLMG